VGKARPSRSSAASSERRSKAYCSAACATSPGSMASAAGELGQRRADEQRAA
jgi:hypothetical protein